MNHTAPIQEGYTTLTRLKPNATDAWAALEEFRQIMVKHITAGLSEVSGKAVDLEPFFDADQFMTDMRAEFDPYNENAGIQDCFANAFHAASKAIKEQGGEPLFHSARGLMPSGIAKPRQ